MEASPLPAGPELRVAAAIAALRSEFTALADPERAAAQQRYMKSAMPYYGLAMADVRRVSNRLWAVHRWPTRTAWLAAARALWDGAEHREEWYAVVNLLQHRAYRPWHADADNLATLRHLIVTGAWWDVVDELASHCVGTVLRADPARIGPLLRGWARDENLWVRRTAILAQLTFGADTDPNLLADCCAPSLDDRDFFARKAIGWALRQYARTDPAWVRAYVDAHESRLSGLSRREALKHLD